MSRFERERERESNSGAIILAPLEPKQKSKSKIIIFSIILIIGVVFLAIFAVNHVLNRDDGGVTDNAVLELTEDSYVEIASIQNELIRLKEKGILAVVFSSEEYRAWLNESLEKVQNFSDALGRYDTGLISSEYARENFLELRKAIENDLPLYISLVEFSNEAAVEFENYDEDDIIYDEFNSILGDDYPRVYYYELIGNIIGGLRDAE